MLVPIEQERLCRDKNNKFISIDPGVRTFLTVYSPEVCYEIGTNTNEIIDRLNKRLDNIKSSKDNNIISENKYNKLKYYYLSLEYH